MMNDQGLVVGVEHIKELYEQAKKNISKSNSELLKSKKIVLLEGDGRLGYKPLAPYNVIHVGAGIILIYIYNFKTFKFLNMFFFIFSNILIII